MKPIARGIFALALTEEAHGIVTKRLGVDTDVARAGDVGVGMTRKLGDGLGGHIHEGENGAIAATGGVLGDELVLRGRAQRAADEELNGVSHAYLAAYFLNDTVHDDLVANLGRRIVEILGKEGMDRLGDLDVGLLADVRKNAITDILGRKENGIGIARASETATHKDVAHVALGGVLRNVAVELKYLVEGEGDVLGRRSLDLDLRVAARDDALVAETGEESLNNRGIGACGVGGDVVRKIFGETLQVELGDVAPLHLALAKGIAEMGKDILLMRIAAEKFLF